MGSHKFNVFLQAPGHKYISRVLLHSPLILPAGHACQHFHWPFWFLTRVIQPNSCWKQGSLGQLEASGLHRVISQPSGFLARLGLPLLDPDGLKQGRELRSCFLIRHLSSPLCWYTPASI